MARTASSLLLMGGSFSVLPHHITHHRTVLSVTLSGIHCPYAKCLTDGRRVNPVPIFSKNGQPSVIHVSWNYVRSKTDLDCLHSAAPSLRVLYPSIALEVPASTRNDCIGSTCISNDSKLRVVDRLFSPAINKGW